MSLPPSAKVNWVGPPWTRGCWQANLDLRPRHGHQVTGKAPRRWAISHPTRALALNWSAGGPWSQPPRWPWLLRRGIGRAPSLPRLGSSATRVSFRMMLCPRTREGRPPLTRCHWQAWRASATQGAIAPKAAFNAKMPDPARSPFDQRMAGMMSEAARTHPIIAIRRAAVPSSAPQTAALTAVAPQRLAAWPEDFP
jgi:hypothetical protein